MNAYRALKERQQKEVNNFPMVFAFTNESFYQKIKELWNIEPEEAKEKIISIGAGGFILKEDRKKFTDLIKKLQKELEEAIKADTTGNGFIYDMFNYELANHEFTYTRDITDALEALNLSNEDIEKNPALKAGLEKAINRHISIEV